MKIIGHSWSFSYLLNNTHVATQSVHRGHESRPSNLVKANILVT